MPKKSDSGISVIQEDIDPKIAVGFDRGVDYEPMKERLIKFFNDQYKLYRKIKKNEGCYNRKIKIVQSKMLYTAVAMVQLRNGSRISEACQTIKSFCTIGDLDRKVVVKIAKSESIKYKDGEKYTTKPRYRKMIFPKEWIGDKIVKIQPILSDIFAEIPFNRLKKRVLDYLLIYHQCNTHSLRYACINYLIYVQERPLNDVAKFVGHVDLSMLTKYTQQKNCEKIFDLDM